MKESQKDKKERHTVVVFSSSDNLQIDPGVCFKGVLLTNLQDITAIPTNITVRCAPLGSYDEAATVEMISVKFPPPNVVEQAGLTAGWRGVQFDQFDGQLTEVVIKQWLRSRRLPLIVWGHLTALGLQCADRFDSRVIKRDLRADQAMTHTHRPPAGRPRVRATLEPAGRG